MCKQDQERKRKQVKASCLTTLKTRGGANSAEVKRENFVSNLLTRIKFPLRKNANVSSISPSSSLSD